MRFHEGDGSRKTVLVIDDNEDCRVIYSMVLTNYGLHVETVGDGAEGIVVARRVQPDVILLDIVMPARDGLSILRSLRADPSTVHIPVIAITAQMGAADLPRNAGVSFDAICIKPIAPAELVSVVFSFLSSPSSLKA